MKANTASQTHQLLPAQSATLEVSGSPSASLLICNHVPDAGKCHGLEGAPGLILVLIPILIPVLLVWAWSMGMGMGMGMAMGMGMGMGMGTGTGTGTATTIKSPV